MKIKKCGFLLSLVMVICFVLPSFTSAEEKREVNLISGVKGYKSISFIEPFLIEGKQVTNTLLQLDISSNGNGNSGIFYDLGSESDVSGFLVSSSGGGNTDRNKPLAHFTFYDSNKKILGSDYVQVNTKGEFDKKVNFKKVRYVRFGYFSNVSSTTYSFLNYINVMGIRHLSLEEVKNLNAIVGVDNVNFTWDLPKESQKSIDAIKISTGDKSFKMGSLVKDYRFTGLTPDTEYSFLIQTEKNGELSEGVVKKVRTLPKPKEPMPLVKPPENVIVTPQNGKMVIAWDDVKSPYLEGYNVYIDGKKVNDEPLKSNKLIVKSLENGKSYKVQISAVNKENVEGEKSKGKEEKPSVDALEVEYDVKMPFSAFDLLTSSVSLLGILGGFILLGLAIIWFRPLKRLIVNAVRKEKDKK